MATHCGVNQLIVGQTHRKSIAYAYNRIYLPHISIIFWRSGNQLSLAGNPPLSSMMISKLAVVDYQRLHYPHSYIRTPGISIFPPGITIHSSFLVDTTDEGLPVTISIGPFVRVKEAEDGGRPLSICVAVRVDAGRFGSWGRAYGAVGFWVKNGTRGFQSSYVGIWGVHSMHYIYNCMYMYMYM